MNRDPTRRLRGKEERGGGEGSTGGAEAVSGRSSPSARHPRARARRCGSDLPGHEASRAPRRRRPPSHAYLTVPSAASAPRAPTITPVRVRLRRSQLTVALPAVMAGGPSRCGAPRPRGRGGAAAASSSPSTPPRRSPSRRPPPRGDDRTRCRRAARPLSRTPQRRAPSGTRPPLELRFDGWRDLAPATRTRRTSRRTCRDPSPSCTPSRRRAIVARTPSPGSGYGPQRDATTRTRCASGRTMSRRGDAGQTATRTSTSAGGRPRIHAPELQTPAGRLVGTTAFIQREANAAAIRTLEQCLYPRSRPRFETGSRAPSRSRPRRSGRPGRRSPPASTR